MGLPDFDPSVHHVGIGPDDDLEKLYGFLTLPGYERSGQRYGAATDFGGDTDLIGTPTLSRWTQDDWTGGQYQPNWGKDPAQYAYSENVVPSQFARSVRSCPPLHPHRLEALDGEIPVLVFGYQKRIIVVLKHQIITYHIETGTRETKPVGGTLGLALGTQGILAAGFDRLSRKLYVATGPGQGLWAFDVEAGTYTTAAASVLPTAATGTAQGVHITHGFILACFGGIVWVAPLRDDGDPPSDFTRAGRLPGTWRDAVSLNGQVYILCADTDLRATLVSWSGNAGLLPVTDFPYNFVGECVEAYGGRVYVGGSGKDIADAHRYAELYEVTAGSLRLVRTFAPESFTTQRLPRSINDMTVYEGLLWFGDNGRGLIGYSLQDDAFHGGPMLQPGDGQRRMLKLLPHTERLYAWINHPLDLNGQSGLYRVANAANEVAGGGYEAKIVTSDFGPEPDREKRWALCKVLTRYGPAKLGYSTSSGLPGGDTFEEIAGIAEQHGDLYTTTFDLSSIPASKHIRLRYSLPRGTQVQSFTELISATTAFTFLDTGKWSWRFTVNGSFRVEGRDLKATNQNLHDIGTELRRYWRDRLPLRFRDLDGQVYKVKIDSFTESRPNITPPRMFVQSDGQQEVGDEALYHLSLLEV